MNTPRILSRPNAIRVLKPLEGVPLAGMEHSVKLSRSGAEGDRLLIGVAKQEISRERLLRICEAIAMPADFHEDLQDRFVPANQVLFGFEGDGEDAVFKVYLEFWDRLVERIRSGNRRDPELLHIGYKWRAESGMRTVTHYTCLPMLPHADVVRKAEERLSSWPDGARAMADFLRIAAEAAPEPSLIYMDVSEEGSTRASFDVNCYSAKLPGGAYAEPVSRLWNCFELPEDRLPALLDEMAERPFGHIAGGAGRNGEPFVTVYYEIA